MNFRNLIQRIQIAYLRRASDEKKVKYWRRQGMKIGRDCHINTMSFSTEPYLIEIGDHVAISAGTDFVTHDGAIWCFRQDKENESADIFGKIIVGNNVFIGINCTILPNTIIGNNTIIGAGSIVRGKFPDDVVIIGNPAKVVSKMSIQKFLYFQNPGLCRTHKLSDLEKAKIVKELFAKEKQENPDKTA
jgi:acetyltransferase-like isoleucine patch superfamily enzyme